MNTLELVKKAYAAWESKDIDTLREVLHPDYIGKVQGFEIVGIEGAKQCLEQCPFQDARSENETYITEGDRVVRIWTMVATKPFAATVRMAELNVVKDGKIILNEAVFDSAAFPKELFAACSEEKTPATAGTKNG